MTNNHYSFSFADNRDNFNIFLPAQVRPLILDDFADKCWLPSNGHVTEEKKKYVNN